jgi:hypothetical protein
MDQHQQGSRSSSRSELPNRSPYICVPLGDPHKAHTTPLSSNSAHAPPSPSSSSSTYPSPSTPSHRHTHPAITSTPQTNEANALFPPHYITSSHSTPRRSSSILPSPFLVPSSPVLPTLLTMSPQVLAPPPVPLNPPSHDQPRPSSRSERLLRETLRRDRAASLSPRSRMPRTESRSGRIASTSSEMFHCACTDSDDEGDHALENSLHVSLLFANLPQHHQNPALPLQRSSKSSADVQSLAGRESDLKEKRPIAPLCHVNLPHRSAVPRSPFEGYICGATVAQARDRHADRDLTWSSPEVSTYLHMPLAHFFGDLSARCWLYCYISSPYTSPFVLFATTFKLISCHSTQARSSGSSGLFSIEHADQS